MASVADLLEAKGNVVWTVGLKHTVYDAIKLMDEKGIGALLVMQKDEMAGILSERDYARKVILKGRSSKDTYVKDIMTTRVFYAHPEQTLDDCMVIMTEHHIRHLPVMHDSKIIGLVSLGDVVKEIIRSQRDRIEQLEHSITWQESY